MRLLNYEEIFSTKADRLIERSNGLKDNNLALFLKCRALPFYCESSVLSKILMNREISNKYMCIALDIAEEIKNEPGGYTQSVCYYTKGVKAALDEDCKKSLEYLNKAKSSYFDSGIKDPLYCSWICCEIAYCYKKQSQFDNALLSYFQGFLRLKWFEHRNKHLEFIRRYLHHAILSDFKEIYADTIIEFIEIAKILQNEENWAESLVYLSEAAILSKNNPALNNNYGGLIANIKQCINKIDQHPSKKESAYINYAKGIILSFESDYKNALDLLNESKKIYFVKTIDDLIFSIFLNREIAYFNYQLSPRDTSTNKNIIERYKQAFIGIEELEWEINLYLRTLGIFYNLIGAQLFFNRQHNLSFSHDKLLLSEQEKEILKNEVGLLTENEISIINIEIDNLLNPLYDFEQSLKYSEKVFDEVLIPSLHLDISQYYTHEKKFKRSRVELHNAFESIEKIKNEQIANYLRLQYYHALGYIDQELNEYENAIQNYSIALDYAKSIDSVEKAKAVIHFNLALISIELEEYEKTYLNLKQCIHFSKKSHFEILLLRSYCECARLKVLKDNNFIEAREFIEKAEKRLDNISNNRSEIEAYINFRKNWINFVLNRRTTIENIQRDLE